MYKQNKTNRTTLSVDKSYKGETIEEKVRRIVNNKEPIKDGAPLIYTERKDGVQPSYNIRTDRFEVAIDAHEAIYKSNIAKREERAKIINIETKKEDTGGESIQGTDK